MAHKTGNNILVRNYYNKGVVMKVEEVFAKHNVDMDNFGEALTVGTVLTMRAAMKSLTRPLGGLVRTYGEMVLSVSSLLIELTHCHDFEEWVNKKFPTPAEMREKAEAEKAEAEKAEAEKAAEEDEKNKLIEKLKAENERLHQVEKIEKGWRGRKEETETKTDDVY